MSVRTPSGADGDPERREHIVALDKARVWHPYTEMSRYRDEVDPFVIVRAEGSRLFDADGSAYLDGNSSWWTASLGHNHPRLVEALRKQSEVMCHTALAGIAHEPASLLAEKLCQVSPEGLEHVFYSDNGSTAVEVSMKMALQYWQQNGRTARRGFIALDDAFHGETLGVTALGGVAVFRRPFDGALLECVHIPSPAKSDLERALDALRKAVRANADTLAGLVVEPLVQGAAGMQIYGPEFLREARAICDETDTFLICDEVFTGYGRTGTMWAHEQAGITPDFICTAKGLSAGMLPMGATLTTERVFEGFLGDPERAFHYGHTFSGNPLGAAVALEVLRVFDDEEILANIEPKARRIREAFRALEEVPGVARSRGLGMVGALDLEGPTGYLADAGWRVFAEARKRGAYLRPLGNVVYVTPPLNTPDDDLDELLQIVSESVRSVATTL